MKVGFIGLGNVGGKLAGSLLRNGFELWVRDLNKDLAEPFLEQGAHWAESCKELAEAVDLVITCLPSPAACAEVMEAPDGVIAGLGEGKIWMEMSTTDAAEVQRIAKLVEATGAKALESPVSGGCHRAATGNISILVAGDREAFDRAMPALKRLGRRILHTGPIGSASILKVITNYLASTHLVAVGEALMTARANDIDLATAFEAIRISSGNSFVHETESQVILNGSYNISFTLDLVLKDVGLFQAAAERKGVPLELSPKVLEIFEDGVARYGPRFWSSGIVKRLEDETGLDLRAPGFPAELEDDEPEEEGYEITPAR
jgi:3-hydroxyisobutyrate dehydrogenase